MYKSGHYIYISKLNSVLCPVKITQKQILKANILNGRSVYLSQVVVKKSINYHLRGINKPITYSRDRAGVWIYISKVNLVLCPVKIIQKYIQKANILKGRSEYLSQVAVKKSIGYRLRGINKPITYSRVTVGVLSILKFQRSLMKITASIARVLVAGQWQQPQA